MKTEILLLYLKRIHFHFKKYHFIIIGEIITIFLLFLIFHPENNAINTWACKNNAWIPVGTPSFPKPLVNCKKESLPKTKKECLRSGGVWKKQGPEPVETCNIKARDRGNICDDSTQCEGLCQANLTREEIRDEGMKGKQFKGIGQCSVWRVELGCFGVINKGVISVLCID